MSILYFIIVNFCLVLIVTSVITSFLQKSIFSLIINYFDLIKDDYAVLTWLFLSYSRLRWIKKNLNFFFVKIFFTIFFRFSDFVLFCNTRMFSLNITYWHRIDVSHEYQPKSRKILIGVNWTIYNILGIYPVFSIINFDHPTSCTYKSISRFGHFDFN